MVYVTVEFAECHESLLHNLSHVFSVMGMLNNILSQSYWFHTHMTIARPTQKATGNIHAAYREIIFFIRALPKSNLWSNNSSVESVCVCAQPDTRIFFQSSQKELQVKASMQTIFVCVIYTDTAQSSFLTLKKNTHTHTHTVFNDCCIVCQPSGHCNRRTQGDCLSRTFWSGLHTKPVRHSYTNLFYSLHDYISQHGKHQTFAFHSCRFRQGICFRRCHGCGHAWQSGHAWHGCSKKHI